MKVLIAFILIVSLNIHASDEFEDEFEQELAMEESKNKTFDPLNGYNRLMTDFNDIIMINIFEPVTKGYRFVTPRAVRKSVNNFFSNLYFPISVSNNLLQLKFKNSMDETFRFLTNSTLGIFGLFDVADSWYSVKPHKEDLGQTLGHYGVGSGFPLVVPFFGQSNLRDFGSSLVDIYAYPVYWHTSNIDDRMISYTTYTGIRAYKKLNEYSLSKITYEDFTKGVIDLYPFIRDAYEQNRDKLIEE